MKVRHSISLLLSILLSISTELIGQELYFPEVGSDDWENVEYEELGWCAENLENLLELNEQNNSKALIILKQGKIALEQYFDDHDATKNWYWASAGKSLTSCIVGVAQEEGLLDINDITSDYLGEWVACDDANTLVTVEHQLTMTTGLDYNVDIDCTDVECLECLNLPGSEWYF